MSPEIEGVGPSTDSAMTEALSDQIAVANAEVQSEVFLKEFPDAVTKLEANGDFEAVLNPKQIRELNEMRRPERRLAIEARLRREARLETVEVESVRGETHRIPAFREGAFVARGEAFVPRGKVTFLGRLCGEFCPRCDRRRSWCECREVAT